MKSILMSVQPQWLAKILNGEKTREVRKAAPEILATYDPKTNKSTIHTIEIYLYCTKNRHLALVGTKLFTCCNSESAFVCGNGNIGNGRVVAKFTLSKVDKIHFYIDRHERYDYILSGSCLSKEQLAEYGGNKDLYGWHIDDLIIFDEPMNLSEFSKATYGSYAKECVLTRPPQSWQYVEVCR